MITRIIFADWRGGKQSSEGVRVAPTACDGVLVSVRLTDSA